MLSALLYTFCFILLSNKSLQTEVLDMKTKAEMIRMVADMLEKAKFTRDRILPVMEEVRKAGDILETVVGKEYWPMPTYQELLTSV